MLLMMMAEREIAVDLLDIGVKCVAGWCLMHSAYEGFVLLLREGIGWLASWDVYDLKTLRAGWVELVFLSFFVYVSVITFRSFFDICLIPVLRMYVPVLSVTVLDSI